MSARVLGVLAALLVWSVGLGVTTAPAQTAPPTVCCSGGTSGGDAGGSASGSEVLSWVVGARNGGVLSPGRGAVSCGPWEHHGDPTAHDVPIVRVGSDGTVFDLFGRACENGAVQVVWVPRLTSADLGALALDEVRKLVVPPAVSLSPILSAGGFVNWSTWLAVTPVAPVSASAGPLPDGLSATTTATVSGLRWDPGDGSPVLSCRPWGALPPANAPPDAVGPCSWTPHAPSAPQFAHSTDLKFHGSVSLVWTVAWAATNGTSGALGSLTTTTPVAYKVREIQTIGVDR